MYLFIEYPKCSTCRCAKKFLDDNNISYQDRNIVTDNPSKEEIENFKKLNLKDKLPNMTLDEKISLLSTDGMLVKRPILVSDDFVLTGFKEQVWKDVLVNE